jgi:glycosyltransferase involved in cell wall biosynthesis
MEPVFMRQLWSIITISTKMKEHYAAFGGNPDRIFICPNGIDGDRFRPEIDASPIREQYRLGGKTVIGFMGNLEPWHGLSGLLDKFPELAEKYDNLCLLLVGIPPLDWDNLPDSIDKRLVNYKDKIICTGKIAFDSMPMHLKAIDIFVLPYANMDFFYFSPLKLFESMGVGCAVVGSDIGQVGEVITDGQDGLLFPPGNYEEMGARISKLIENPQIRTSLGQAAADNIHRNYTWEKITGGMIDAFYYSFGKYIPHLPPNS